ncbi:acyl-homoserine-lactone synthase [Oceaniglobus roseus]|uniref:acyl-homoserine-lactone synthase n=1 Tax=Oceaniglobus roseus TaxID=1737570 RepID=UPI0012FFF85B|nr:acyl-homoserine-lactone synthase [Kandeliimicrobium roseum]
MTSKIVGVTFGFPDLHEHGSAFYQFLGLRKRFFVDTLNWQIPHNDAVEMDQYDNPTAEYSLALRDGEVVGGARIMRFADRWGIHGCMLQDAAEGRIPGIPEDLLPRDRSFAHASECTRLVLSDKLTSTSERQQALSLVVAGLVSLAIAQGTRELVTLTVPGFRRSLRKLGYGVDQLGEKYQNDMDGRSYAILRMPARHAAVASDKPQMLPANEGFVPRKANI